MNNDVQKTQIIVKKFVNLHKSWQQAKRKPDANWQAYAQILKDIFKEFSVTKTSNNPFSVSFMPLGGGNEMTFTVVNNNVVVTVLENDNV